VAAMGNNNSNCGPTATTISFDASRDSTLDFTNCMNIINNNSNNSKTINNNDNNNNINIHNEFQNNNKNNNNNTSNNNNDKNSSSKVSIKNPSSSNKVTKSKVHLKRTSSLSAKDLVALPNILMNDGMRSTAYVRQPQPADLANSQSSPRATRFVYNWDPVERKTTKVVQAHVKIYKPAKRVDMPSRPPSPYRVQTEWETSDTHFHNHKRTQEMKRLQYLKEHTNWSIYPYAAIDERETYNKNIRETLKEQMEHKEVTNKKEYDKKLQEFKMVSRQDANQINEDRQKRADKLKFLSEFRDENKQLMEDRWMNNYMHKKNEWQQESQLLEQDPVNWSKTLK